MKQQINLYKFLPHRALLILTPKMVIVSYSIFLCLLILNFVDLLWDRHQKKLYLTQINRLYTKQRQQLAELMAQYPIFNEKDLQSTLQQLREQVIMRKKIYAILAQRIALSDRLVGLSEGIASSVWLSEIQISNSDQTVMLSGYAAQALPIQQSLDQFMREAAFEDMIFRLQELSQITTSKNYTYLSFRAMAKPVIEP